MTACQIDDGKPAHTERGRALNQQALIIGTTMLDYPTHAIEDLERIATVAIIVLIYKSGYSTHKCLGRQAIQARSKVVSAEVVLVQILIKESPAVDAHFFTL